jgi:predicted enzyme related to lactoylglutathione lyase
MTTDVDAAEAFYRAVIGWGAQDWGQPDMRYIVMSAGEKMVAGLMPLPAEVGAAGGRPAKVIILVPT